MDVGVNKGLKDNWDKKLVKWQRANPRERIPKTTFTETLTSVWHSLESESVIGGFQGSGMYDSNLGKPNHDRLITKCQFKEKDLEEYYKSEQSNMFHPHHC